MRVLLLLLFYFLFFLLPIVNILFQHNANLSTKIWSFPKPKLLVKGVVRYRPIHFQNTGVYVRYKGGGGLPKQEEETIQRFLQWIRCVEMSVFFFFFMQAWRPLPPLDISIKNSTQTKQVYKVRYIIKKKINQYFCLTNLSALPNYALPLRRILACNKGSVNCLYQTLILANINTHRHKSQNMYIEHCYAEIIYKVITTFHKSLLFIQ